MLNVISDTCPQDFTATRGRIQSPGFPGYRNNVYCQINLHYKKGHLRDLRIFIDVEELDVDKDHDLWLIAIYEYGVFPSYRPVYISSGHNFTGEVYLVSQGSLHVLLLSSRHVLLQSHFNVDIRINIFSQDILLMSSL